MRMTAACFCLTTASVKIYCLHKNFKNKTQKNGLLFDHNKIKCIKKTNGTDCLGATKKDFKSLTA